MKSISVAYFYRKKFVNFKMDGFHTHNRVEIMYVSSGRCFVDTPLGTKELDAGKFIVLGRNYPHALVADSADIINVEFGIDPKKGGVDVVRLLEENVGIARSLTSDCEVYVCDGEIYPALRDLVRELQVDYRSVITEVQLCRLLVLLGRLWERNQKNAGVKAYVKRAQEFITRHCDEKISVGDVADFVGVNRSYLQTLFKRHTGLTITEYANKTRVDKAVFLLRNSNLDTTAIALECGFASRQHFGLTFRKLMGVSPHKYRKTEH